MHQSQNISYADHIVKSALESISKGYAVFLLAPGAKVPLAGSVDSRKNASTDRLIVESWFAEYPGANYGIGLQSRDLVIDCDPKNYPPATSQDTAETTVMVPDEEKILTARHNVMLDLLRDCPALYNTRIVHTPSNGWHFYLRKPPEDLIAEKNPGVDFLSEGKHVVGPGSILHGGKSYVLPDKGDKYALEITRG